MIGATTTPTATPPKRRGLPWVSWGPRQAALGVFGGLFVGVLLAPVLVLPFDPDLDSLGAILVAQLFLDAAVLATAVYMARGEGGLDLRAALGRLGWRRFKASALALALGTLVAYFIAVAIYIAIFGQPHQKDVGGELGLNKGVVGATAAVILIAVVAPVAEETFFRGFLFGGLRSRWPRLPAALVSALLFGGVHAPEGPTAVVPLAILGFALGLLYEQTGSLWPCVFAHSVNNSLALAVAH